MTTFKVTAVASSAASPYTLTSFLSCMSISTPNSSAGKKIESVAVPPVAFSGPSKGYSTVPKKVSDLMKL